MQINIQKLERYINDALNACDATLLGGFSGSVIELLGRFLGKHKHREYSNCYKDFLEAYLPTYYTKGDLLYKLLRCEGAHAVIAQSGVRITSDTAAETLHLQCVRDTNSDHLALIIYLPILVKDLKDAMRSFVSDLESNSGMMKKCQEIFSQIYQGRTKSYIFR